MNINKVIKKSILFFWFIVLSSIGTAQDTTQNDLILCENFITLTKVQRVKHPRKLESTLFDLIRQKATYKGKRILPTLSARVYKGGQNLARDSWLKRNLLKIGNPYTIYSEVETESTKISMTNYLFNNGYFNAYVKSKIEQSQNCVTVTYIVFPGKLYKLNEVTFITKDSLIQTYLEVIERESFLQIGQIPTDELFRKEIARINRFFKNAGFAAFSPSYINPLPSDTIGSLTNVTIEIKKPQSNKDHLQYNIGEIHIYPNYLISGIKNKDTLIKGIYFHHKSPTFFVPSNVLISKLKFTPNKRYNYDDYIKTYQGFNNLEAYKFVSIESLINSQDSSLLDYHIKLTPNKKWSFTAGAGVSRATGEGIQINTKSVLALNTELSLKNSNVNKSGWAATIELSGSTELAIPDKNNITISSFSWEAGTNIVSPRYLGFPGTMKFLNYIHVVPDKGIRDFKRDASSNFNFKIGASNFPEFYSYTSINSNLEYRYRRTEQELLDLQTISLEYYQPDTGALFTQITKDSEFAKKSFLGTRLFTSVFFKSLRYSRGSRINTNGLKWAINGVIEQSGSELKLINKLYNVSLSNDVIWKIKSNKEDIEFGHFVRGQIDLKLYSYINSETYLVLRIGPGIAYAFGDQVVPYIKQYYVGGPLSIRAWNAREIGPGTDSSTAYSESTQPFFATGDFKLDLNAEFRFTIWSVLKGAIFIDAGNVWNLNKNQAKFLLSKNFLNEMAVGTGVGLRLDFGYFLLRSDFGYKVLTPYKIQDSRKYYSSEHPFTLRSLRDATINIAVGMPF